MQVRINKKKVFPLNNLTHDASANTQEVTYRVANNPADVDSIRGQAQGHYKSLDHIIADGNADNGISEIIHTGIGSRIDILVKTNSLTIAEGDKVTAIIRDDSDGISDMDKYATYGVRNTQKTILNACGCGPKNVPAYNMVVRTTHNGTSSFLTDFKVGTKIGTLKSPYQDLPHGTEVSLTVDAKYMLSEVFRYDGTRGMEDTDDVETLARCLDENLGFIYAGTLIKYPHIKMHLKVVTELAPGTKPIVHWDNDILPLGPMFLQNDDLPVYSGLGAIAPFHDQIGDIQAAFQCGRVRPSRPSILGYYSKRESVQYWVFRIMGRALAVSKELVPSASPHPNFNGVVGEVDLEAPTARHLPQMTTTKTGFTAEDEKVLLRRLYKLIPGLSTKIRKLASTTEHDMLCHAIAYNADPHYQEKGANTFVFREYDVGNFVTAKIDVIDFARNIGYEVKSTCAGLVELNQAKCYLEECAKSNDANLRDIKLVQLCAPSFSDKLQMQVDAYNREYSQSRRYKGRRLELVDITRMDGIDYDTIHANYSRKKN
jgi:hypothetical protein